MASLNRKRKFENHLLVRNTSEGSVMPVAVQQQQQPAAIAMPVPNPMAPGACFIWKQTSHTFHSPIASFTRPEKTRQVSNASAPAAVQSVQQSVTAAPAPVLSKKQEQGPRVSDGIVLKAFPNDITVNYNDVVCGKGKTTSSLVGNQRYKVWINLYKDQFAKSLNDDERRNIACKIVNAVTTSVPQGRFLSLDIHTGLWYNVGYQRAVGITLETLMIESGMMNVTKQAFAPPPNMAKRATQQRIFASKAA